ncbi:TerB family tellurite resistance protein [Brevibacillus invocatus]|uniref:TerB family tellurite resistance protein n=1 Tax=Brevibacillus invocatus TaxID=173959 RepID=A0A3M8BXX8_9BACL|nr:TerB family tellurite resistance protein [Brevibacillus invocatus]
MSRCPGRKSILYTKTEKEKHISFASIRLMICVGHADGYIGNREMSRIHELVNSEHFTLKERQILMDDMDYPKRPEVILEDMVDLTPTEKLVMMRKLYHMALIDQRLSMQESEAIRRIASMMGIPQEKQRQVEEWVRVGIKWRESWKDIVEE